HFMAEQITHGQWIMWRTALSKRARVLDVGCGMGGNLIPFKWKGHETIGCDWGEDYAQKGRQLGLDIRVGGLDAVADAGPFDLIICSHVLEHAVDPIDFAQSIAGLLAEDGALYIEVPGLLHIAKTYAGNFLLYLQNAHAWHFTSSTLAAVLARAGLAIEQSDESIWCVAKKQAVLRTPWPQDGQRVLNELLQLENQFTYLRAAA
ncbi:MAG TPA: class I SAM-dependent methyltransferase, partial [Tepidisphaeraceae bacterium]|nr:class I SAM-dependent methyltransferase [Tepidisphaeraceae bacterium]